MLRKAGSDMMGKPPDAEQYCNGTGAIVSVQKQVLISTGQISLSLPIERMGYFLKTMDYFILSYLATEYHAMKDKMLRKRQGFEGQQLIVLPKKIVTDFLTTDPITRQVYITDIGYYPKAYGHYVERHAGIGQHIIIYCVEGKGWVEINRKKTEITPSQFIVIPANTPHRYSAGEKDPWTIYWVHFRGDISAHIVNLVLQDATLHKPQLTYNENRIKLFQEIYINLEKGYSIDNLRYVNMIFYHFLSSILYEDKFNYIENKKEPDLVSTTVEFMQKKIHTVCTLQEFARLARLSVSHFSAMFRKKTGYAPMEYFNHLKVQKACQYLLVSDMTIKEIAAALAVDDQYYFSRMFSKLMGLSPSEYRKRNKAAHSLPENGHTVSS
jgi:AraC-like DNA-binding protein